MKTTVTKSGNKSIALTLLFVFLSIYSRAETIGDFFHGVVNDLSRDGGIGLIVVGSILGFGITLLVIAKIVAKYTKEDDTSQRNIRTLPQHRHHHHHRVIKKSA